MLILYLKIQCGISQIWCYQIYLVIPATCWFPDEWTLHASKLGMHTVLWRLCFWCPIRTIGEQAPQLIPHCSQYSCWTSWLSIGCLRYLFWTCLPNSLYPLLAQTLLDKAGSSDQKIDEIPELRMTYFLKNEIQIHSVHEYWIINGSRRLWISKKTNLK